MERSELDELHYITHIGNLPSICSAGLVSHRRAAAIAHQSVADPNVQELRKGTRVPQGRLLHDYVNLYMTARNPMLYKLTRHLGLAGDLCVVQVSTDVLDLPGVVVSDMNAAAFAVRFYAAPEGLEHVDSDRVFRHYWTDGDAIEQERCKKAKCAEVLVPDQVPPQHLTGICVGTNVAHATVTAAGHPLPVALTRNLFFNP